MAAGARVHIPASSDITRSEQTFVSQSYCHVAVHTGTRFKGSVVTKEHAKTAIRRGPTIIMINVHCKMCLQEIPARTIPNGTAHADTPTLPTEADHESDIGCGNPSHFLLASKN